MIDESSVYANMLKRNDKISAFPDSISRNKTILTSSADFEEIAIDLVVVQSQTNSVNDRILQQQTR